MRCVYMYANSEQLRQPRPGSGLDVGQFSIESAFTRVSCSLLARCIQDRETCLMPHHPPPEKCSSPEIRNQSLHSNTWYRLGE